MTNKWNYQPPTNEQVLKQEELSKKFRLSPAVCLLLVQRGIDTEKEVQKFLNPNIKDLHDPFEFPDMPKAVAQIGRAHV